MSDSFTVSELRTIEGALRVALDEYAKAVEHFGCVAWGIEQGSEIAPFAPGEGGVIAANRLRDQFEAQRLEVADLLDIVIDGELIRGAW
jgi:hypothetical protein